MIIEFNIPQLLELKLTFEEYFLLFCVKYGHKQTLLDYSKNIAKINTPIFEGLKQKRLLDYTEDEKGLIYFETLKIMEQGEALFPKVSPFEVCFSELRETYPKEFASRKLHTDKSRCERLYKEIIMDKKGAIDMEKHKLILKCVKLYVQSLTKTGKMTFIQAMPAFLNQRNYEAYEDEAKRIGDVDKITNDSSVDAV